MDSYSGRPKGFKLLLVLRSLKNKTSSTTIINTTEINFAIKRVPSNILVEFIKNRFVCFFNAEIFYDSHATGCKLINKFITANL